MRPGQCGDDPCIRPTPGDRVEVDPHVGDSTRAEIEYARWLGLPVKFTHPAADPGREANL
ncbi:hypothetical protein ACEZCY_04090 [Streptacidiphilus sp. N1-12]|uniref:Uncharacterized protein n=2 Tax=Streptacidiphilus alkalitolerans TaxID=3342712 RepID=A0ABV6W8N7_9ACTN